MNYYITITTLLLLIGQSTLVSSFGIRVKPISQKLISQSTTSLKAHSIKSTKDRLNNDIHTLTIDIAGEEYT